MRFICFHNMMFLLVSLSSLSVCSAHTVRASVIRRHICLSMSLLTLTMTANDAILFRNDNISARPFSMHDG